jgi:hypothetical protein
MRAHGSPDFNATLFFQRLAAWNYSPSGISAGDLLKGEHADSSGAAGVIC